MSSQVTRVARAVIATKVPATMSSRDKLIKTSTSLFSEKGYEGTSVLEIAKRAGTNVSLVNYHFGGKKGLLAAVLSTLAHEKLLHAKRLLKNCETEPDFRIRIDLFLNELNTFFVDQASLISLFFDELEKGSKAAERECRFSFSEIITSLENFLKAGQKQGFIRNQVDVRIHVLQLVAPLIFLTRSRGAAFKHFKTLIEEPTLREELIKSLTSVLFLRA